MNIEDIPLNISDIPADTVRIIAGYLSRDHTAVLKHTCQAFKEAITAACDVCKEAAANGNLSILKWARDAGYPMTAVPWEVSTCAPSGNIDLIEWIMYATDDHSVETYRWVGERATVRGQINVLEWVMDARVGLDSLFELNDWMHTAAAHGQLDLIKWCMEKGAALNPSVLHSAIAGGNLAVCKWIYDIPIPFFSDLSSAIATTSIEVVEWMHGLGHTFHPNICDTVAKQHRFDLLK